MTTGASTAQAGILEDMPRLDYSGGASCPSLLLEPQRSNLLEQAEYYNTYWIQNVISVNNNVATSPERLQNASKLVPDNGTGGNRSLGKPFSGLSGIHTFSTFAKAGEYGYVALRIRNSPSGYVMFDLTDGSIHNENDNSQYVTDSAKIEDYGNGWYRCSASFDPSGSVAAGDLYPSLSVGITGDEGSQWDGDGTSGIYIYGAQFEQASYPTSYIPTYGSSVTRSYDTLNDLDLDGLFSGNSYTILFDIDLNDTFNNKVFAEAKKSTGGSSFTFRNFNGLLRVYNNLDSTYLTGSIASDSSKWVVRIDGSTADVFSYNSGSPTKTSGTPLATIRDFGKINFSGGPTISSLNQFLIFPTALSDAECNSLVQ